MAISKRRTQGNDCHNMSLTREDLTERESDFYEVDEKIQRKLDSSGITKKTMSTRRSMDNSELRRELEKLHSRYFMNGSCRSLSREEIERFQQEREAA